MQPLNQRENARPAARGGTATGLRRCSRFFWDCRGKVACSAERVERCWFSFEAHAETCELGMSVFHSCFECRVKLWKTRTIVATSVCRCCVSSSRVLINIYIRFGFCMHTLLVSVCVHSVTATHNPAVKLRRDREKNSTTLLLPRAAQFPARAGIGTASLV